MKIAHVFADSNLESRGIKFTSFLKDRGIEVIPYLRSDGYLQFVFKTVLGLLCDDARIIHAHRISGFVPAILAKLLRPGLKIIYDKHDIHPYDVVFDRMLFFARAVFVCSELHYDKVKKIKKETYVLPNYSEFKPISPKKRQEIRKELNLTTEDVFLLYQGSIVPCYGLDMLVMALKNADSRIKVGILGWIKDEDYWRKMQSDFTLNIFYIGTKDYSQMNDYVGSADIGVVLFQDSELTRFGNPAKLFEFIACRIPLIVTDVKSVSKYIEKYGNGFVVKSERELIKAINDLSDKKTREKLSKKSPNLRWKDTFEDYLKILGDLK